MKGRAPGMPTRKSTYIHHIILFTVTFLVAGSATIPYIALSYPELATIYLVLIAVALTSLILLVVRIGLLLSNHVTRLVESLATKGEDTHDV